MKKKLLSLVLMLVMVLSLVACGSQSGSTPKDVLKNMRGVEVGTSVCELVMQSGTDTVSLRVTATAKDQKNALVSIDAKLALPSADYIMDDYALLTDITVVDGETFYVNMAQVMDFLVGIDSQFAMIESYLGLTGDYLMVTMDDLEQFADMASIDLEAAGLTAEEEEVLNKFMDAAVEVFGDMFNEYATNAGADVMVVSEGKIVVTFTQDNYEKALDALATIDMEKYLMTFSEKLDEIAGNNEQSTAMTEDVDGLNDELKAGIEAAKSEGLGENVDKLVLKMGTDGNGLVVNLEAEGKGTDTEGKESDVKIALNFSTNKDKLDSVSVPSSVMNFTDFMNAMGALMGSVQ